MKKFIFFVIVFLLLVILCSCNQVVDNISDEIKLNKWSFTNKNYELVELKFIDDIAQLKVEATDKSVSTTLKGLCIIDSDKIAIYNESDKENYIFTYKLIGEKLELNYLGGKITLIRQR